MNKPRITVCICTYDRYDVLTSALESVLNQSLPRDQYRIVVVDNSPDHDKAEAFGAPYRDEPFLDYRIERTPGLSNARNVGARECGTEYIAYMDDDAIASPQWLELLADAFDRYGDNAVVAGGRVDPIWEIPRPAWLHDWNTGYVSVVDWGGETRIAAAGEWLAGTNIAFRVKPLLEFGGFDAKLGRIGGGATLLSNEEIAMLDYFRGQGFDALYVPEASVRHLVEKRRLTQEWFRKRAAWQAASDFMMDPAGSTRRAAAEWDVVLDYFFRLPPRYRTVCGFYLPTEDADTFRRQLAALQLFTAATLSGFAGIEEVPDV